MDAAAEGIHRGKARGEAAVICGVVVANVTESRADLEGTEVEVDAGHVVVLIAVAALLDIGGIGRLIFFDVPDRPGDVTVSCIYANSGLLVSVPDQVEGI